ncbi:hypothetical protein HPP92_021452 [Vanilla planifolia]|uniref:Uncharacterized protein n=1 Tax=Vanilla planifolia TaxID=51239 RepID=A0A835UHK6_VANPL|nr:hypothetical protein HPP92_021452 [Vanilla planifolia]
MGNLGLKKREKEDRWEKWFHVLEDPLNCRDWSLLSSAVKILRRREQVVARIPCAAPSDALLSCTCLYVDA